MSACEHAQPIGSEPIYSPRGSRLFYKCQCGATGPAEDILGCSLDVGCNSTLWCPVCKTGAWEYDWMENDEQ